jgi:hypothetical protein
MFSGADGSRCCKDATSLSLTGSSRYTRSATYFYASLLDRRSQQNRLVY